jgi:hypothetical protein
LAILIAARNRPHLITGRLTAFAAAALLSCAISARA